MDLTKISFPEPPRSKLRAHLQAPLCEAGQPNIDEIVDIAIHAAVQARQTLLQVLQYPSNPSVTATATGIAASLVAVDMAYIEAFIRAFGARNGKPVYEGTIGGRNA